LRRQITVVAATVAVALVVAVLALVVEHAHSSTATLTGHPWTLSRLVVDGHELPLSNAYPITLSFKPQVETFSGSSGCNSYGGSYTLADSQLHLNGIRSTLKLCATVGVMERESAYLLAPPRVESYRIEGDALTLDGDNGRIAMTFRP
jgi:heat shock protein HslJ